MFCLNPQSGIPLYVQLQEQIQQRILSGLWSRGTQLPSVRELSATLEINPMTVTKVYQILEREGFVETKRGLGTFVAHQSPALKLEARRRQLEPIIAQLAAQARHLGLEEKSVLHLFSEAFRKLKPGTPDE